MAELSRGFRKWMVVVVRVGRADSGDGGHDLEPRVELESELGDRFRKLLPLRTFLGVMEVGSRMA